MASTWVHHRPLLERISTANADAFTDLNLLVVLWSEESTLDPGTDYSDDTVLSALDPGSNELVATGYTRDATTGGTAWVAPDLKLTASNITWAAVASGHTDHGVSGFTICEQVGDGTTDADQILLATCFLDTPTVLNGGDLTLGWPSGVVTKLGPA